MHTDTMKMRLFPLYRLACRDVCCHLKGNKTYLTWSQSLTFQDQELSLLGSDAYEGLRELSACVFTHQKSRKPRVQLQRGWFYLPSETI